MSEVAATRAFNREIASVIGATVSVVTNTGKSYTGTLKGVDQNTLTVVLADVTTDDDTRIPRIFIYGSSIVSFSVTEKEISLEGLAKELEKVFPPGGVRYFPDTGVIVVMNKIRVTPEGVDGSGPLYERVAAIAREWMEQHGLE
ncbi:MAG: Lsm family RNA-binding protein [Candidatus Thorarchaeota archaeon]|nr:MAG: small nuclear ribonucleoprotein (Sm) [Candidatus Thorarchaeota archaeon]RLI57874.1 MAG: small nuclear ribonucleoprotein (Sm) [Candidatus Thorarchaeota archaeon]